MVSLGQNGTKLLIGKNESRMMQINEKYCSIIRFKTMSLLNFNKYSTKFTPTWHEQLVKGFLSKIIYKP